LIVPDRTLLLYGALKELFGESEFSKLGLYGAHFFEKIIENHNLKFKNSREKSACS
jgi:hypothetical protein